MFATVFKMTAGVNKKIHIEGKIFDMNTNMGDSNDIITRNFCKSFRDWSDNNWRGTQEELGKYLGISKGQVGNLLLGRRGSTEFTRRAIAAKIGLEYETMIGIKGNATNCVAEPEIEYQFVPNQIKNASRKHRALLLKTLAVLESDTHFATALISNIESFYQGVQDNADLTRINTRKIAQPEKVPKTGDRRKKVG